MANHKTEQCEGNAMVFFFQISKWSFFLLFVVFPAAVWVSECPLSSSNEDERSLIFNFALPRCALWLRCAGRSIVTCLCVCVYLFFFHSPDSDCISRLLFYCRKPYETLHSSWQFQENVLASFGCWLRKKLNALPLPCYRSRPFRRNVCVFFFTRVSCIFIAHFHFFI